MSSSILFTSVAFAASLIVVCVAYIKGDTSNHASDLIGEGDDDAVYESSARDKTIEQQQENEQQQKNIYAHNNQQQPEKAQEQEVEHPQIMVIQEQIPVDIGVQEQPEQIMVIQEQIPVDIGVTSV